MFTTEVFDNINEAVEYIKKILAELDTPSSIEYNVIHSLTETECIEDGGSWDSIGDIVLGYLRDLDAMQGYMVYDKDDEQEYWDYIDWEECDNECYGNDEIFVSAGEGLVVLHNPYALCEDQFPVIVIKKSIWKTNQDSIVDILGFCEPDKDYTSKISPAVYVELFFND